MPLYIVRWPNLSAAIVRARDREDLLHKLDEEGNAEGCRIKRYDGPLFIDFELDAELETTTPRDHQGPVAPEHLQITIGQDLLEPGYTPRTSAGCCDTGWEMCDEVMKFAFPHTYQTLYRSEEPQHGEIAAAVRKDAMELVRTSWCWEHTKRSTDPAARLAVAVDMPTQLARRYLQDRDREPPAPREPPPAAAPRKGGRGRRRR